jgi:hypothetical protein
MNAMKPESKRCLSMVVLLLGAMLSLAAEGADGRSASHYDRSHFYPERGRSFERAPRGATQIYYRSRPYYYRDGAWYRPDGARFIVVAPPIGLVAPFLPRYYSTFWVGGYPYYYANDVYYAWRPEVRGYVVAEPPATATASVAAPASELFVYPMKGQTETVQATDRYECHAWAVTETGFDPVRPQGGVEASVWTRKREDYQRALAACLTGRGYSVR